MDQIPRTKDALILEKPKSSGQQVVKKEVIPLEEHTKLMNNLK